jgi:hypothetical protein
VERQGNSLNVAMDVFRGVATAANIRVRSTEFVRAQEAKTFFKVRVNELHALHDHLQFSLNVTHAVIGAEHMDSVQFLHPIIITPEVAPPPVMGACCIVQPAIVEFPTCSFAISAASLAVNAQHPKYTHNASRSFEVVLAGK